MDATTRREQILHTASEVFVSAGIRASVQDIAAASGILPGSLYHHFESKDALVIELVDRYHAALDSIAAASLDAVEGSDTGEAITEFGCAIARCAIEHRAAVLLTLHEAPSGSGPELNEVVGRTPSSIVEAMEAHLRRGRERGVVRAGFELPALADRLCQGMIHVAIGVFHRDEAADRVPALKIDMMMRGLVGHGIGPGRLASSDATNAANREIASWPTTDRTSGERADTVLAAVREQFGRRGYGATTVRDVAAAAGMSPRAVYRVVESKEAMLAAVLSPFIDRLTSGWSAIIESDSSALERLDALLWFDIKVVDRFEDEYRVLLSSVQHAPPNSADLDLAFPAQLDQVAQLLDTAMAEGDVRLEEPSSDVAARALYSLMWTPATTIRALGPTGAMHLARETLLQGAVRPPAKGS